MGNTPADCARAAFGMVTAHRELRRSIHGPTAEAEAALDLIERVSVDAYGEVSAELMVSYLAMVAGAVAEIAECLIERIAENAGLLRTLADLAEAGVPATPDDLGMTADVMIEKLALGAAGL